MSQINVPLLRKTLEYAEAHPEEIDLGSWARKTACGTTACIAGTAAILAGHEIAFGSKLRGADLTTAGRHIADVAKEELGLTEDQVEELFFCRSIDEVWEVAEKLTNGEIQRPLT